MPKPIREKIHRLPHEEYGGFVAVAFTSNILERKPLFVDDSIIRVFQEILLNELKLQQCSSYAYIFMPDHIHMIIAGECDSSNVKECMDMFKQRTGFWLYKKKPDYHWQKDYYDHIIRKDEDMNSQIRYILQNPVRAGITNSWKKYPYKGSTKFNFDEWDEQL